MIEYDSVKPGQTFRTFDGRLAMKVADSKYTNNMFKYGVDLETGELIQMSKNILVELIDEPVRST